MMTKTQAIALINKNIGTNYLNGRNTTFAQISSSRNAWWMNIKLENFSKNWNIILVGEEELMWLKIPADTFNDPEDYFKIWKAKNAVDIYISANFLDRHLKDIAAGGVGVDFRPFVEKKFKIPQEMGVENSATIVKKSKPNKEFNLKQGSENFKRK